MAKVALMVGLKVTHLGTPILVTVSILIITALHYLPSLYTHTEHQITPPAEKLKVLSETCLRYVHSFVIFTL